MAILDFLKLGGTERRYRHKVTGEVISRRQYEKLKEGGSLEQRAKARRAAGTPVRKQQLRGGVFERFQAARAEAIRSPMESPREIAKRHGISWQAFKKSADIAGDRIQSVGGRVELENRSLEAALFDNRGRLHKIAITPREARRLRTGRRGKTTVTINGVEYHRASTEEEQKRSDSMAVKEFRHKDFISGKFYNQLMKAA